MLYLHLSLLIVFISKHKIITASYTNFEVKSFRLCNYTQGLFKFHGNISKENGIYYGSGSVFLPIPLDENVGATCKIESMVMNTYVELFTIREKYFCKAANIYLGELWYDVQRAAQVIPKTCPLPAGRKYETHHVEMDFNKISLQTFPFGFLRFTMKAVDNKHPTNNLLCIILEVENIPN